MWSFGKILARHPPSKEATKSVIRILRASPGGLTTQDLYKRLNRTRVVESNAGDTEAQPENPIRSMRHLKTKVLKFMQDTSRIEKVHMRKPLTFEESQINSKTKSKSPREGAASHYSVWVWRLVSPSETKSD